MRVVDPREFKKPKPRNKYSGKSLLLLFALPITLFSIYIILSDSDEIVVESNSVENIDNENVKSENIVKEIQKTGELRVFTDNEFVVFYNNLLQKGLERVENPPSITGNDLADRRIRDIAERRGYKLRSSPNVSLGSVSGLPVQKEVVEPWQKLQNQAQNEGINIRVVSAYRSVSSQRELFTSRLYATGANLNSIINGNSDDEIDEILVTTAVPGYSKHHTGYTIDLWCVGYEFENFKNSNCNDWISANNYAVAKKYGFIPSYPPKADLQGPDPEAWEYVYVGEEFLYN